VKNLLVATPGSLTVAHATATAAAKTAGAARAAGGAVAIKAAAASLVVGTLSFGAGLAAGRHTAPIPAAATAQSVSPAPNRAVAPSVPSAAVAPAPPLDDAPVASALPTPIGRPSASSSSGLWEEAALLREAQRALQGGDPGACLAILDRMAARYPSGALGEERGALRVLALCGSGRREEARALGAAFLRRYPASVHAARVRASCAGADR
jgi:hypothetical protein